MPATSYIDLPLGSSVTLDIAFTREGARRVAKNIAAVLAGIEHGQYVMVRIPETVMETYWELLTHSAQVTVKYLHEGASHNFTSPIVNRTRTPAPLLSLGYPLEMASFPLRKEPRVACQPYARVVSNGRAFEGAVADISHSGCRLILNPTTEEEPQHLASGRFVEAGFQLPGFPGEIEVTGEIRWSHTKGTPWMVGIAFTLLDEEAQDKIARFMGSSVIYA